MKKLLALAVVLAVLMAAGCLGESSDNKNDGQTNCTWELPHAKVIHLTNMEYPSSMVEMELADFSTFKGGSRVIVENNTIKVLEG